MYIAMLAFTGPSSATLNGGAWAKDLRLYEVALREPSGYADSYAGPSTACVWGCRGLHTESSFRYRLCEACGASVVVSLLSPSLTNSQSN